MPTVQKNCPDPFDNGAHTVDAEISTAEETHINDTGLPVPVRVECSTCGRKVEVEIEQADLTP
jgi:hypothetical protein